MSNHPTDTSEELREILAEALDALGFPYSAARVREGDKSKGICLALAAMSRVTTTHAGEGMVEAAKEAVAAFAKEQPEAWGAPTTDNSEYGFEWNFSDGSTLWFDIEPDHPGGCGFGVYWRRGDQKAGNGKESHHLRALSTTSQPQPERVSMVVTAPCSDGGSIQISGPIARKIGDAMREGLGADPDRILSALSSPSVQTLQGGE